MCDEAAITRWAKEGLSRRQFGALGGIVAVAACSPMDAVADESGPNGITLPAMGEENVSFETEDGTMDGFFVSPMTGPSLGVILWPDIAGLREAKRNMARRLAGRGYAVLVVNPYYRDQAGQIWEDFADFAGNGGWPKAREMRKKHTAEAIMSDARAAVAWMDAQESVNSERGIGTQGYCMGGPLAMWTAAAVPNRVRAAASFHGGGLVRTGDPMSPHELIGGTDGRYLIAIAQNDAAKAPEEKGILSDVLSRTGSGSKVEVYAGDHGWTVPDSPVYAQAPAEKAWADLLTVYEGAL